MLGCFFIVRLAVMLFPAFAVLGAFPASRGLVTGLGRTVAAAVVNAIIFGVGAGVTVAVLGILFHPGGRCARLAEPGADAAVQPHHVAGAEAVPAADHDGEPEQRPLRWHERPVPPGKHRDPEARQDRGGRSRWGSCGRWQLRRRWTTTSPPASYPNVPRRAPVRTRPCPNPGPGAAPAPTAHPADAAANQPVHAAAGPVGRGPTCCTRVRGRPVRTTAGRLRARTPNHVVTALHEGFVPRPSSDGPPLPPAADRAGVVRRGGGVPDLPARRSTPAIVA